MAEMRLRSFADADALITSHIEEIGKVADSDVDMMSFLAIMTAAYIWYAHHDGIVEDAIEAIGKSLLKVVEAMDHPNFKQPH